MPTWRERAAPVIADVLAQYPDDSRERRKALREAYPFGERTNLPYQVWLDEIAKQTGRKKKSDPFTGQLNWLDETPCRN